MIYVANIEELDKIIRNKLIEQSGLPNENVLNGNSRHGVELSHYISNNEIDSFKPSDTFIIFKIEYDNSENDMTEKEDANHTLSIKTFKCKCIVYGDKSESLANELLSRFETSIVRLELESKGIHLINISQPISLNEFINESFWYRTDIDLLISCAFLIHNFSTNVEFENISDIIIK